MVHKNLIELREDINILSPVVERCESSVPHKVLNLTIRLKDSLYEKNMTDKEYKDELVKLVSLTSKFQSNCTCSEKVQYFPKLAARPSKKE